MFREGLVSVMLAKEFFKRFFQKRVCDVSFSRANQKNSDD